MTLEWGTEVQRVEELPELLLSDFLVMNPKSTKFEQWRCL